MLLIAAAIALILAAFAAKAEPKVLSVSYQATALPFVEGEFKESKSAVVEAYVQGEWKAVARWNLTLSREGIFILLPGWATVADSAYVYASVGTQGGDYQFFFNENVFAWPGQSRATISGEKVLAQGYFSSPTKVRILVFLDAEGRLSARGGIGVFTVEVRVEYNEVPPPPPPKPNYTLCVQAAFDKPVTATVQVTGTVSGILSVDNGQLTNRLCQQLTEGTQFTVTVPQTVTVTWNGAQTQAVFSYWMNNGQPQTTYTGALTQDRELIAMYAVQPPPQPQQQNVTIIPPGTPGNPTRQTIVYVPPPPPPSSPPPSPPPPQTRQQPQTFQNLTLLPYMDFLPSNGTHWLPIYPGTYSFETNATVVLYSMDWNRTYWLDGARGTLFVSQRYGLPGPRPVGQPTGVTYTVTPGRGASQPLPILQLPNGSKYYLFSISAPETVNVTVYLKLNGTTYTYKVVPAMINILKIVYTDTAAWIYFNASPYWSTYNVTALLGGKYIASVVATQGYIGLGYALFQDLTKPAVLELRPNWGQFMEPLGKSVYLTVLPVANSLWFTDVGGGYRISVGEPIAIGLEKPLKDVLPRYGEAYVPGKLRIEVWKFDGQRWSRIWSADAPAPGEGFMPGYVWDPNSCVLYAWYVYTSETKNVLIVPWVQKL